MANGERIRLAREFLGLTQTELAARLNVTQSAIAYAENGRLAASNALVEAIALQTGFPPAFFREPPEPDFPLGSLLFRSKKSVTSREETRAYRHAQVGFLLANGLLRRMKPVSVRIPSLDDVPAKAAQATRSALGVSPDKPINRLINTLERGGVLVLALPITLKDIDAFSVWAGSKQERPVIVMSRIPRNEDGARYIWSAAHELGHLVLHRQMSGDIETVEREANQFAGEFLLPETALREELVPPVTLSSLAELKPRWKTSMQALCMRAGEINIITERQKKYLFQQISMRDWRKREPPNLDVKVEGPQSLRQLAEITFGKPINYKVMAHYLTVSEDLAREYVEARLDGEERRPAGNILTFTRVPSASV